MTKNIAKLAGIGITALIGTAAWAGAKNYDPVVIDVSNRTATGSLGDARKSADTQQYIGCGISTYAGSSPTLSCFARDTVTGGFYGCSTTNADLMATARAINGDSFIRFTWDTSNTCISLSVTNGSQYEPK